MLAPAMHSFKTQKGMPHSRHPFACRKSLLPEDLERWVYLRAKSRRCAAVALRNAPAGAVTHPHIWPRAAHKIAPNGARFSRRVVLLARQHGTVKTVPYKSTESLQYSH